MITTASFYQGLEDHLKNEPLIMFSGVFSFSFDSVASQDEVINNLKSCEAQDSIRQEVEYLLLMEVAVNLVCLKAEITPSGTL